MLAFYRKRANIKLMKKTDAIRLLGGTVSEVARAIGIKSQAVTQWPEELPRRIEDRVIAAIARRSMRPELLGLPPKPRKRSKAEAAVAS